MRQDVDLEDRLALAVIELAKEQSPSLSRVISCAQAIGLQGIREKHVRKMLLRLAIKFRRAGQFGRLRTSLLFGVTLSGDEFLKAAERGGLLLPDNQSGQKFGRFLTDFGAELKASNEPTWSALQQRLKTYEAYLQFVIATSQHERTAVQILKTSPRHIIKQLLALANVLFLERYFQIEVPLSLQRLAREFGEPEELATVISLLVALGNSLRLIDSWDLGAQSIGPFNESRMAALLTAGRALVQRHEIAKQISLFGYQYEVRAGKNQQVYYLRPPFADFERTLRLGYIRSQVASRQVPTAEDNRPPIPAMADLVKLFLTRVGSRFLEIRHPGTPFRRVRLSFPIVPDLCSSLKNLSFYEDALYMERLAEDFLFALGADSTTRSTTSVALDEFLRLWRIVQFFCLVDIEAIRPFSSTDPTIFLNSAVRVVKEQEIVELISATGVEQGQVEEFFRLVTADVKRLGHFDLQYQPFVRIQRTTVENYVTPSEIAYVPGITVTANILRNVQIANQIRSSDLPNIFVDAVARMLQRRFLNVSTNRRIETPKGNTDVDVVVLEGDCLYLFECKHSVFPTEPHEVWDAWGDIEKGVQQLRLAAEGLQDSRKLRDYLAGWFPGTKLRSKGLVISRCVLSSHRIFSGLEYQDVPIRDLFVVITAH